MDIETYWRTFLRTHKLDSDTRYFEAFSFGIGKAQGDALAQLVLDGTKQATASALLEYQDGQMPVPGDCSIVLNGDSEPVGIIQTTKVMIIPFNEMTYDICKLEGEDDTLESWVNTHTIFFKEVAQRVGFEFSESMDVVFELFELVEGRSA